jgi:DNA polymerase-3 subunit alpha
MENIRKLREIYKGDDLRAKVLKEAERLEGTVRNTGIHAAGIIIAPSDLTTLIPVATSKDSKLLITQIEGKLIEEAGVLKMDFLGLKTLSIIKNALEMIRQNHGVEISMMNLPINCFRKAIRLQCFSLKPRIYSPSSVTSNPRQLKT